MVGALYLGWKYVTRHRWKSGFLTGAVGLILFLPPALLFLIERGAESLNARAESTPLLLGAPGSPLELTLNSLYFDTDMPVGLNRSALAAIDPALADAIPLYVRFRSRDFSIVGTNPDYLRFRELRFQSGRSFALLGECVIGANVARKLDLGVGDSIISSPESLFDLAGVYPLKMQVVGVLETSLTPDDDAILTDLKTTWVIEGLGHGHQDLAAAESPDLVLSREESLVTANAALVQFNEITDENRESFHFHGDDGTFPISAVIVDPADQKARTILLGRFVDGREAQLVRPDAVIESLGKHNWCDRMR
jgi:putative ABC transport system permease protein